MSGFTRADPKEKLRRLNGEDRDAGADQAAPRTFSAVYRRMADIEPREISYLWSGYLVARKLNIVAGLGGVGKGQLMAHLIARWSRSDAMPYEVLMSVPRPQTPLRTLILAAEDDAHEDIRPRLDANTAHLDHVFILDGVRAGDGDDLLRWVDVEKHMPAVLDLVARERIDVVYIDPLSSYMPGVQRQSAGSVRDTLGHLQRLINATGVTIIATLHLGKSMDRRGAHRILDSVAFVNAARNVLGVADLPDAHQPEEVRDDAKRGRRRVIEVLKSNSSIPGKPLVWSRPLNAPVLWHGESPIGFDACFAHEAPETRLDDAMAFLQEELADAAKPRKEIEAAARKKGLSDATLRRAKSELGVQANKKKGDKYGPWLWAIPRQDGEGAHSGEGAHEEPDERLLKDEHSMEGAQVAHVERLLENGHSGEGAQPIHREHLRPDEHLPRTLLLPVDVDGETGDDYWTR